MADDFYGDDQDEEDLQQEWKAREAQFKNLGYKDGIAAGKDQTLQQGFEQGFKESVQPGFDWGRARGAASALKTLGPNASLLLRPEAEGELAQVSSEIAAISTEDALRHFSRVTLSAPVGHHVDSKDPGLTIFEDSASVSQQEIVKSASLSSSTTAGSVASREVQTEKQALLEKPSESKSLEVAGKEQLLLKGKGQTLRTLQSRVWSIVGLPVT